jgi:hypothetical protein
MPQDEEPLGVLVANWLIRNYKGADLVKLAFLCFASLVGSCVLVNCGEDGRFLLTSALLT